jgi:hypothetical protein
MSEQKIVGIHQPNFLPWLGYFHKMMRSDVFVLLDDVQYSKNSVGNRSYIRRKDARASYLTAPVRLSKKAFQNYNEIELDYGPRWPNKGLNMIKDAYQKAPYFQKIYPPISEIILHQHPHLASLNIALINFVIQYLNIKTQIVLSHTLTVDDAYKSDLVLEISKQLDATKYLSGTGAKKYNNEQSFTDNNIEIIYTRFTIADEYKAPDENNELVNLSILHFLFNYDTDKISELIYCNTTESY